MLTEQLSRLMRHGSSSSLGQYVPFSTLHNADTPQDLSRHQVKHPLAPAHCLLNNAASLACRDRPSVYVGALVLPGRTRQSDSSDPGQSGGHGPVIWLQLSPVSQSGLRTNNIIHYQPEGGIEGGI